MTTNPRFGAGGRACVKSLLAASTVLAAGCLPGVAFAQMFEAHRNLDENGVDLTKGDFVMAFKEGAIGSGKAELPVIRRNATEMSGSQWDAFTFQRIQTPVLGGTQEEVQITFADQTFDAFTRTGGGAFNTAKANGAFLSGSGSVYTYTAADGTTFVFSDPTGNPMGGETNFCINDPSQYSCMLAPVSVTRPDGSVQSLEHDVAWQVQDHGTFPPPTYYYLRINRVRNSFGYSATFTYSDNGSYATTPPAAWFRRTGVEFRNHEVSGAVQGNIAYSYPSTGTVDVTDMAGNSWRLTKDSIRRPGEGSASFSLSTSSPGNMTLTRDGIATVYARTVSGSTATMVVTNALSQNTTVVSDLTKMRPTSVTNYLGEQTQFTYDGNGRLTRVTQDEGNYEEYTLDGRGNVTMATRVAKGGSGLSNIVTSAAFDASCSNPVTCNQPNSTTDARGKVTDYTYDATHGGVLTVTAPAPGGVGTRPQTRYAYSLVGGEYLLTGVSACRTNAAPDCVGTADESKTVIAYDANRNVTSVTSGAGDNSLTAVTSATYSPLGDTLTVDGPLSGTADTTTWRYDAARRLVGTISPDPDGGGALKRRAQKLVRDSAGRVTETVSGNVTGTDDPAWAAFTAAEKVTTTWDGGRKAKDVLSASSTDHAVAQYGYDAVGRLECSAVRMNSAAWGSLPAACTLGTPGAHGPDRISKTSYDAAGRVSKVQTGYGTAEQADDSTATYSDNGQLATLTDGNGNKTTYEYDGHDRLQKTRYPHPSSAGTSSTTDYEELTYDAGSNVVSRRLRDGNSIGYSYDDLNRLIFKNLPGSEPDVGYGYDLVGHMTWASEAVHAVGFAYDALGRNTVQSGPLGSVVYTYDLAGNRTRTTWPDSFYVDYDRLVTGEVTAIREYGAGSGAGVLAVYGYDDLGRRTSLTRGNGVVSSYGYDAVSRLASLGHDLASSGNDVTATFTHNPASQIASRTVSNTGYSWTGAANVDRNYAVNGLNQYSSAGAVSFAYDAKGNLTTSGADSYSYSSENLLLTGPGSVTLGYDPLLRLYETSAGRRFAYDGGNIIAEYNSSNVLQARHVFGPGTDEALVSYDSSGNRNWLIADERGSIVARTDASGAATAIRAYNEYGIPSGGDVGRFGYTGQAWLPELGLAYYKARMYSPTLGRFMQTDPIGYDDGMNLYAYVANDPVNASDPTGTDAGITVTGTVLNRPVEPHSSSSGFGHSGGHAPGLLDLIDPNEIVVNAAIPSGQPKSAGTLQVLPAPQSVNDGSILEQRGRRNSTGKRGEAGKNPNPNKHGPKRAFGKPGYVTDEGRDGQRGRPRPARPGEPGYGEGGSNFTAGDALIGVGIVVVVGGVAVLLAPEIAAALAAAGLVSLVAN